MNTRRFAQLTTVLAALALAGCASFEREWKAAERQPGKRSFAQSDDFTGPWDGHWTSAKHRTKSGGFAGGRLRCLLTRIDDRHYTARFKANWMIFTSSYRTVFEVERSGRALQLAGEHKLSAMFGGVYKYTGRVTPEHFTASYDSTYDHGKFEMRRPQSGR
jgi:hypothetical protein